MKKLDTEMVIYEGTDGQPQIKVHLQDETIWLSQQQLAELYKSSRANVLEHIRNIYKEKELTKESTCRNFRQVRLEGKRQVQRETPFYNLGLSRIAFTSLKMMLMIPYPYSEQKEDII